MAYKIYLVEDEENLNSILKMYLEKEGYSVKSFLDGKSAQEQITSAPDLWILDIMLPDINGYTLIKQIKEVDESTPVIFISARNKDLDRVVGLEMGSDDYISKPFLPRELVIKTKRLLELTYGKKNNKHIRVGDYIIDKETRTISENNNYIELTSKEFDLVLFMVNNLNQAFSREQILRNVWDENYYGSDRVVDDTVRRIRKKMKNIQLDTIYGFGYRMVSK